MQCTELMKLVIEHYNPRDSELIQDAITLATKAHEGQLRASGEPYITHPLSVAAILVGWRMDVDRVFDSRAADQNCPGISGSFRPPGRSARHGGPKNTD